ncbi:hypothetical protein [Methanobrevibacter curvatus]|uniref:Uncharacterized protein n=1 Tax=Methanobrevibacter curvatus TaxID=49547 RepID=A0A166B3S9_9EURY|nr:hypothetical protein [Methanobrevibacter curvatus]KZX12828.1 hypothetical protein MBCUR_08840 [Methanobrevibacter curvatus]
MYDFPFMDCTPIPVLENLIGFFLSVFFSDILQIVVGELERFWQAT